MGKILHVLYVIYAFAVFLLFMLILFPFVILARFLGRIVGGNLVVTCCRFWADAAFFCWGITHKNLPLNRRKPQYPVIYIFNHCSYLDIPILLKAIRSQPIRVLGKAAMAKIPIFGFFYRAVVVLVDRSDAQHRNKSVQQLKNVLNKNISIVIAPEGTFNETGKPLANFYDGAFRIAIETQTPIVPVVFLDAYDRMKPDNIFSLNPGKSRAIFLDEIPITEPAFHSVESLKLRTMESMELALCTHKASWIKLGINE